jgi:hypothetical protein
MSYNIVQISPLYGLCSHRCDSSEVLVFLRSVRRLLVTASVVHSSPILVTLMMEVQSSFETSVLIIVTRRGIPEDAVLHSHRHENLKSYIIRKVLFLLSKGQILEMQ